jgi:hypothetical protein
VSLGADHGLLPDDDRRASSSQRTRRAEDSSAAGRRARAGAVPAGRLLHVHRRAAGGGATATRPTTTSVGFKDLRRLGRPSTRSAVLRRFSCTAKAAAAKQYDASPSVQAADSKVSSDAARCRPTIRAIQVDRGLGPLSRRRTLSVQAGDVPSAGEEDPDQTVISRPITASAMPGNSFCTTKFTCRCGGSSGGQARVDLVEHIDLAATSLAQRVSKSAWMQGASDDRRLKPRDAVFGSRPLRRDGGSHPPGTEIQYIRNYLPNRPHLQPASTRTASRSSSAACTPTAV